MTERVDSVGDSEEGESSSVGSSVETSSEDSEEEEADPRVKEEVGSRNDGIFISIEIHYRTHSKLRPPFCLLGLATSMRGLIIEYG